MVTAIHPVNATVQKVERKEPPEPEGWIPIEWDDSCDSWKVESLYVHADRAYAEKDFYESNNPKRLVCIGPDPLPSPASAEIDQLLVNLHRAIEAVDDNESRFAARYAFQCLSERLGRVTR